MNVLDKVWSYTPEQFSGRDIPADRIKKGMPTHHIIGKQTHDIDRYEVILEQKPRSHSIHLQYTFCPTCRKVAGKRIIGFNWNDNTNYARDLIRNCDLVLENYPPGVEYPAISIDSIKQNPKQVDALSELSL